MRGPLWTSAKIWMLRACISKTGTGGVPDWLFRLAKMAGNGFKYGRTRLGTPVWEFPVTRIVAGAKVPGIQARYLKLEKQTDGPSPLILRRVLVYGQK